MSLIDLLSNIEGITTLGKNQVLHLVLFLVPRVEGAQESSFSLESYVDKRARLVYLYLNCLLLY
jgi:hypothetical protein